jgi:hypothetical protein
MDLSTTQIQQGIERIIRAYLTAHPDTTAATLLGPGQGAKKIATQVKPLRDYLDANNISDKRATNSLRSIKASLINEEMNTDTNNDENMPDANRRILKARRPQQANTPSKRSKAEKPHFTPDHFKDPNTRTNRSTYDFQQRRLFKEDMVIAEDEEEEVKPDAQTMLDAFTSVDIDFSDVRTGGETIADAGVSENTKRMVDKNHDVFSRRLDAAGKRCDLATFSELKNEEVRTDFFLASFNESFLIIFCSSRSRVLILLTERSWKTAAPQQRSSNSSRARKPNSMPSNRRLNRNVML